VTPERKTQLLIDALLRMLKMGVALLEKLKKGEDFTAPGG
jgi:hypothetical protein